MADIANSNLLQDLEGIRQIKDALIVLVKTEWNSAIVNELENGCIRILEQTDNPYEVLTVPGAVEIPFIINQIWAHSKEPDAFIALGCVIRGDTPHFDYVCKMVTDGITQLNLTLGVPVIFGVLTVDNEEQAKERIGGEHGHKGEEAAVAALKMIVLNNKIKTAFKK